LKDSKNTIYFNRDRHNKIMDRARTYGTDGKLLADANGVYHVSFMEKLLVPVLAKLSNLVPGGGIWMNTQRPDWNDANNAIVGNGLSMVTVYQLSRHLCLALKLLELHGDGPLKLSTEVKTWVLDLLKPLEDYHKISPRAFLDSAGAAFDKYRGKVYRNGFSGKATLDAAVLKNFLKKAEDAINDTIAKNKREDGMYHSYNILTLTEGGLKVDPMFLMLEGQSAALGSGLIDAEEVLKLVSAMENSPLLNKTLGQFFLYPIKRLNTFMERNIIPDKRVSSSALLSRLLEDRHEGFVFRDVDGHVRFHDSIRQSADVEKWIAELKSDARYQDLAEAGARDIREIYEEVFAHKQFTGRSGIMYKYEGIGCIYWHQNAKFMLSLQESFTNSACLQNDGVRKALKEAYYRLRSGFGFNKKAEEWGAFPLEPYSHTPYGMPAQQPGMTGQVKEDILTRRAELGVTVNGGALSFNPEMLRREDFFREPSVFKYVDAAGKTAELHLPRDSLAFTLCRVPVVYTLAEKESIKIYGENNEVLYSAGKLTLDKEWSLKLFSGNKAIAKIEAVFGAARMI
jgi:hypothetical protein